MLIGALQKTTLIDYPGRISALVFTQGCNFRCPYCHNPELVESRLFTPPVPEEEVLAFLAKRRGLLDALVVTGGEPLLHADIKDFLLRVKALGFLVKVDTNGSRPAVLAEVLDGALVDYIAMDIKAPLEKYPTVTASPVDIEAIRSSIALIRQSGVPYEFRTTLARALLGPEDILAIGRLIEGAARYVLQPFVASKHVEAGFIRTESFSEEEIKSILTGLTPLVGECLVR